MTYFLSLPPRPELKFAIHRYCGDAMSLIDFMPRRWYDTHELNILIKSGGGTGPVKPGNRRKLGATSSGA